MLRKPVVNGQFYPARARELEMLIKGFIAKEGIKARAKGVILPHAGYVYSGRVAVATVNNIAPARRIVMLGPNHTGLGENFGLWDNGYWETPFGKIEIDEELAGKVLDAGSEIKHDYFCHESEHSIEVELPILQYFFGEFKFVPIACMAADLGTYRKVAAQILRAVKNIKEDILFIASTDMTHYEPDPAARRKDRLALEAIAGLNEEKLLERIEKENITMCGFAPVAVLIACLRSLGASKATVALYQTSGDVSGDYSSVVGYAGVIIQ